jgi:transcription antitermination factor NusG
VISLVTDGIAPARVPQAAIDEIRRREVGGLIELTRRGIKRGDRVRILRGPFEGYLAIYHDSKPRDRIEVLLQLLGSSRRATLESLDVELAK